MAKLELLNKNDIEIFMKEYFENIKNLKKSNVSNLYYYLGGYYYFNQDENNYFGATWINETEDDKNCLFTEGRLAKRDYGDIYVGIWPVIRLEKDELKKIINNEEYFKELEKRSKIKYNDEIIIELGQYPQTNIDEEKRNTLERYYSLRELDPDTINKYLLETGEQYTTRIKVPNSFKEFEYKGEKYIRMQPKIDESGGYTTDDTYGIEYHSVLWFKVEPVKWKLVKNDNQYSLISEDTLLAGQVYYDIKYFLKSLEKQLLRGSVLDKETKANNIARKNNEEKNKKTYFIEDFLEGDIPIILKGKDDGENVELLRVYDRNIEAVCLRNMNQENLVGKSIYDSGFKEMIDVKPTWFKNVERKCEEDPNNVHIIYFDELESSDTNIQKRVLDIIDYRKLDGKWNLPYNARIVVSVGKDIPNEIEEKLKDFPHIEMKPEVQSIIRQSKIKGITSMAIPEQIHPSIYDYIESKEKQGTDLINKRLKDGITELNLRRWKMASKLLYVTNNPDTLESIIGSEITEDFKKFYEMKQNNREERDDSEKADL